MIREIKFDSHEEWLEIRNKSIGGSDASAVVGMNPYRSKFALWAEKTGKVPGFEGNITTQVGAYLEQFVADMFETETGKKLRKKNRTLINDKYPYAHANIDRAVIGEKAFVEIKTTSSIPLMRKLKNSDEFPDAYYCQCVHYLAVTGLEKAYLAVLINCREFKIYTLERNQEEIDALMKAEADFWELVQSDTPPQVDGESSTTETISELYPESNDDVIKLYNSDGDLRQFIELQEQIKALTAFKDKIANRIKDEMKEAGRAESSNFSVSWSTQNRRSFDSKRFVSDHPNINIEDYYNTTTSRIFKVKEKGE